MVKRANSFGADAVEGSDLSWLAAKIPKVARSGCLQTDTENDMQRAAYTFIVDTLWKDPQDCLAVKGFLEQRRQSGLQGPSSTTQFRKVSSLKFLDEAWCAEFIAKESQLGLQVVESLKANSPEIIRQLMCWGLASHSALKLPQAMIDQEVATKVFHDRSKALGNRFDSLRARMPSSILHVSSIGL